MRVAIPTSAPVDWLGSCGAYARRSGRCCAGIVFPAGRAGSKRATAATSGCVRARCCTWRSRSSPASASQASHRVTRRPQHQGPAPRYRRRPPALRRRRSQRGRLRRAASVRGRWDQRLHARACAALLRRARPRPARGGKDRQRDGLPQQPPLPTAAYTDRRPPHPHVAIHTAVERQSRAIHPNPPERMGVQPHLVRIQASAPAPS